MKMHKKDDLVRFFVLQMHMHATCLRSVPGTDHVKKNEMEFDSSHNEKNNECIKYTNVKTQWQKM